MKGDAELCITAGVLLLIVEVNCVCEDPNTCVLNVTANGLIKDQFCRSLNDYLDCFDTKVQDCDQTAKTNVRLTKTNTASIYSKEPYNCRIRTALNDVPVCQDPDTCVLDIDYLTYEQFCKNLLHYLDCFDAKAKGCNETVKTHVRLTREQALNDYARPPWSCNFGGGITATRSPPPGSATSRSPPPGSTINPGQDNAAVVWAVGITVIAVVGLVCATVAVTCIMRRRGTRKKGDNVIMSTEYRASDRGKPWDGSPIYRTNGPTPHGTSTISHGNEEERYSSNYDYIDEAHFISDRLNTNTTDELADYHPGGLVTEEMRHENAQETGSLDVSQYETLNRLTSADGIHTNTLPLYLTPRSSPPYLTPNSASLYLTPTSTPPYLTPIHLALESTS